MGNKQTRDRKEMKEAILPAVSKYDPSPPYNPYYNSQNNEFLASAPEIHEQIPSSSSVYPHIPALEDTFATITMGEEVLEMETTHANQAETENTSTATALGSLRLKPAIADLARCIFPNVNIKKDHSPSVNIKGIRKDIVFVDTKQQSSDHGISLAISLTQYLLKQKCQKRDIAFVVTNEEAKTYISVILNQREETKGIYVQSACDGLKIKKRIVLLLLNFSGFETEDNVLKNAENFFRAFCKAQEVLYMFGSMTQLEECHVTWKNMKGFLLKRKSILTYLPLVCPLHESKINIASEHDFTSLRKGGCFSVCQSKLACGHVCRRKCHFDDAEHKRYICYETCNRKAKNCSQDHKCKEQCHRACSPCDEQVERNGQLVDCSNVSVSKKEDSERHSVTEYIFAFVQFIVQKMKKKVWHPYISQTYSSIKDPALLIWLVLTILIPLVVILSCICDEQYFAYIQYILSFICDEQYFAYVQRIHFGFVFAIVTLALVEMADRGSVNWRVVRQTVHIRAKIKKWHEKLFGKVWWFLILPILIALVYFKRKTNYTLSEESSFFLVLIIIGYGVLLGNFASAPEEHEEKENCCVRGRRGLCDVQVKVNLPCQHIKMVTCSMAFHLSVLMKENSGDAWKECKEMCRKTLECGHSCTGTCGECHPMGDLQHKPCAACTQDAVTLKCGHRVKPSSDLEPTCKEKCLYQCPHGRRCFRKCGDICSPCMEKCKLGCLHGRCTRLCHEPCDRQPCREPCPVALPCGHKCLGFCGEPCPKWCRACNADQLAKWDPKGIARFVFLSDCKHLVRANQLDQKIFAKKQGQDMERLECPLPICDKSILTTHRYINYNKEFFGILSKSKNHMRRKNNLYN